MMTCIVAWDIGAANVKAAWLPGIDCAEQMRVASQPFEIWREKDRLPEVLQSVFNAIASGEQPHAMAVTMTAELSDVFMTKREGVLYVLKTLQSLFSGAAIYIFTLAGKFIPLQEALGHPLECAASNWLASAQWLAGKIPNCLLVDVGSTTTDILPIVDGRVRVVAWTDPERLASGELVYTGALRTNLAAIVQSVPVAGKICRVASEYFAISGDVHLVLGNLSFSDYSCPTPDGRPPSVESSRGRIARLVCADTEMLSPAEIDGMARYICERQILQIREGLDQVVSRSPSLRSGPAVVLGSGAFLGEAAARIVGLEIQEAPEALDRQNSAVAPCLAAAQLLAEHLREQSK
jgi:(4-(4-[2-(gamma-L-glutamylamino)ethyl]phenoxymethyl)furan-2-yl)methanamine synthase